MSAKLLAAIALCVCAFAEIVLSEERKLNNLVSELLEVSSLSTSTKPFTFT